MNISKLPALRMTAEGEVIVEEGVYLDLQPKNKFSVSYVSPEGRINSTLGSTGISTLLANGNVSGQDGEQNGHHQPTPAAKVEQPSSMLPVFPDRLNMTRTVSMPLPSQLSHLQNPHKARLNHTSTLPQSPRIQEVSIELADSIQLAIQTMLQISPPQVLDPAKEQFSACALSVPTSSMSALFTTMKNVNYISANMASFCEQVGGPDLKNYNEFDVGEMLQCVGDALSGAAAQIGVDLVIYHGDVGLKHVYVSGDESGIGFALSHIIRQVLSTSESGDSIELGLLVSPVSIPTPGVVPPAESPPIDDLLSAAPLESNGPIQITIRISHKYAPSDTHQGNDHPKDVVTTEIRPEPNFETLLLRRILRQIGGNLKSDLPPPEAFTSGRTCDLEMVLDRVPHPVRPQIADQNNVITAGNTTLEQLSSFGETLKGKRVSLYASAKGSFAHHLTSYLTAWGMDVTHVSPDGQVDGLADQSQDTGITTQNQSNAPSKLEERSTSLGNPSFIVVDDNIDILKDRLQALRFENQPSFTGTVPRKRPPLSSRTRSTSQMSRLMNSVGSVRVQPPVVILHFTSLANYKVVRDVITSITISYTATSTPLPEVMIIPKPAGPRRFLTALHTAVTKPIVDPLFMPIATSPVSPGLRDSDGSFFALGAADQHSNNSTGSPSTSAPSSTPAKNGTRPRSSRSNSERSTRSNSDAANTAAPAIPPSPLALPDNVEYFSAAAQKLGSSPSSGLVIQSPDGQTAGIYFHPRNKGSSRNISSSSMERGNGLLSSSEARKASSPRISPGIGGRLEVANMNSFSSLGERSPQQDAARQAVYIQPAAKRTSSSSSSASFAAPSPQQVKVDGTPAEDPGQTPATQPSVPPNFLSAIPKRKSEENQGLGVTGIPSPIEGGNPVARRPGPKRGSDARQALAAANKKRGKTALSDKTVIPPISVLIVDDNPINQTILSTFMKRKSIKYDLASNGQEAVEKWKTGGFHLILMDIQMPVMDGIQATKEIRRIEKLSAASGYPLPSPSIDGLHSPGSTSSVTSQTEFRSVDSPYRSSVIIVALTASSLQSDRVAALAAGCNDFLTKPVSLLWLNNKIIEWGSIKALQMWADIRPDAVETMQNGQVAQATRIAARLHVPQSAKVGPARRSSLIDDNAAALALAASGGPIRVVGMIPPSPTASYFKIQDPSISKTPAQAESPISDMPGLPDAVPRQQVKRGSLDSDDGTPKAESLQQATRRNDSEASHSRSVTPMQSSVPAPPSLRSVLSNPPKSNPRDTKSSDKGEAEQNNVPNPFPESDIPSLPRAPLTP